MDKKRLAAAAVMALALVTAAAADVGAIGARARPAPGQDAAVRAGLQTVAKSSARGVTASPGGVPVSAANPWLSNLAEPQQVDWHYWRQVMKAGAASRAASEQLAATKRAALGAELATPLLYKEAELPASRGVNDSRATAERIGRFGTAEEKKPAATVRGELAATTPSATTIGAGAEDNGSIALAKDTGLDGGTGSVLARSVLGDGPHGPGGDGSNDFDAYAMTARAGSTIKITTSFPRTDVDTIIGLYDASGALVAQDDDSGEKAFTSLLTYQVPVTGTYYAFVVGFAEGGALPEDPNDSGSGSGGAATGPYSVQLTVFLPDVDYYEFFLHPGDVLGASLAGSAETMKVYNTYGQQRIGSDLDASYIYPEASPLPGGGNAVAAYVAERAGWYAVRLQDGVGDYELTVEGYRPGPESGTAVQTIFLDFDGARLNTAIFGGPGVRQLSPLSDFLGRWGLPGGAEADMIHRITAIVQRLIRTELLEQGLNDRVGVRVLNSLDHPDVWGKPNVSRVVVGGTVEESGVPVIGAAQSIDPGNFEREETAMVLLDILSGPAADDTSLNFYLRPASATRQFVARAVGNAVAHEIGHLLGSFHVDQFNAAGNLMDQGGNLPLFVGVGADGVGGTGDDQAIAFGKDTYNSGEGYTGTEDTVNVSAWGLTRPLG